MKKIYILTRIILVFVFLFTLASCENLGKQSEKFVYFERPTKDAIVPEIKDYLKDIYNIEVSTVDFKSVYSILNKMEFSFTVNKSDSTEFKVVYERETVDIEYDVNGSTFTKEDVGRWKLTNVYMFIS